VERFALGAATGILAAESSAYATGCAGTRMATVGSPAVTLSGTALVYGKTNVSGPGQNSRANNSAVSFHSDATDDTWAISAT